MATPPPVTDLVALRLMLDDALRTARGASRYRYGTAAVALDGVVERAAHLAAAARGAKVPARADLFALIDLSISDLGSNWETGSFMPAVRKLHRARNAAQHEGLEPNPDDLPDWQVAVKDFVVSLTLAQFGLDASGVALSDAISDEGFAATMREAETALAADDRVAAVTAARQLYSNAVRAWVRLRTTPSPFSEAGDGKAVKAAKLRIDKLEQREVAVAFAADVSEAHWFLDTQRSTPEHLEDWEVERIVAFVFSWVVGFEALRRGWAPRRHQRALEATRRVRRGRGPAVVLDVAGVQTVHGGDELILRCADVPCGADYWLWREELQELLTAGPTNTHPRAWEVGDDGTVKRHLKAEDTFDANADVAYLSAALVAVEEHIVARRQSDADAVAAAAREVEEKSEQARAALRAPGVQVPWWVGEVTWSAPTQYRRRSAWQVSLIEEVDGFSLGGYGGLNATSVFGRETFPGFASITWSTHRRLMELEPAEDASALVEVITLFDRDWIAPAWAQHEAQLARQFEIRAAAKAAILKVR